MVVVWGGGVGRQDWHGGVELRAAVAGDLQLITLGDRPNLSSSCPAAPLLACPPAELTGACDAARHTRHTPHTLFATMLDV